MPLAYTLTMLAWSYIQFPSAFKGREAPLLHTLRWAACPADVAARVTVMGV